MTASKATEVLNALFEERYSALMRYAYRFGGDLSQAEDVVQEAFTELYRVLRKETLVVNPCAWITCVVRRKVIGKHHAASRERRMLNEVARSQPALVECPMEEAIGWRVVDSGELFDVLTPREEEVLVLRLAAMKYREIADQLHISSSSVNTLLARAIGKLQRAARLTAAGRADVANAIESISSALH